MKVLITGGCGFLGSNLASHYLAQGAEVIVADALFRKGSTLNLAWLKSLAKHGQFEFQQLDLADTEGVMALFRRYAPFDYICHVGGQVAMTTSLTDPKRDLLTNVIGTFNVLEAARLLSPDAFLAYSSTNKVYGDLEHLNYEETDSRYFVPEFPNGFDETLPLDFSTPYGCSKGAADQYVRDWYRVYGLKTVVFRHSSIFGGRQFASFDQGWVGWFCQKALEQSFAIKNGKTPESFTISGTGKQVRDVLHADDLIALYSAAFANKTKAAGEVFNIGGGMVNGLSLLELLNKLAKMVNLDSLLYTKIPRRQSDQDFFVANVAKAEHLLGWKPNASGEEGIRKMLEWTSNIGGY